MKNWLAIKLGVALLLGQLFTAQVLVAQSSALCLKKDQTLVERSRCSRLTAFKPGRDSGACTSCGVDMSGEWSYTRIDRYNMPTSAARAITFTQTGGIFEGSNDYHTIVGKVEDRWIRLTQTVSGEEGEGFVLLAEGSLFVTEGGWTLGTLAVVGDTFGDGGAFILRKAP